MGDQQLAITVARVYEGDNGPVLRNFLEEKVLPLAAEEGNRWQATWAFWMLQQRDRAVRALVVSAFVLWTRKTSLLHLLISMHPVSDSYPSLSTWLSRQQPPSQIFPHRRPRPRRPLQATPRKVPPNPQGRRHDPAPRGVGLRHAHRPPLRPHGVRPARSRPRPQLGIPAPSTPTATTATSSTAAATLAIHRLAPSLRARWHREDVSRPRAAAAVVVGAEWIRYRSAEDASPAQFPGGRGLALADPGRVCECGGAAEGADGEGDCGRARAAAAAAAAAEAAAADAKGVSGAGCE